MDDHFGCFGLKPMVIHSVFCKFCILFSGNKVKQLEQDLEVLVGKKCEQSATIITLPIDALMKFNVTSLSLNEVSCQATKNKTHWVNLLFACLLYYTQYEL